MSRASRLKVTGTVSFRFTNSPVTRVQGRNQLAGAHRKLWFPELIRGCPLAELFHIADGGVDVLRPVPFRQGHTEENLQRWVDAYPHLVNEGSPMLSLGTEIVTRHGHYIDNLFLDGNGCLVVAELKRGPTLDAQTKLQAQIAREVEETRAMRARRPTDSGCAAITGLAGLAAARQAAESAYGRAADAETGRIAGDRAAVPDAGAAAGNAARFESLTSTYCNGARAGEDAALCRGGDALHAADLKAGNLFDRRTFANEAELRTAVELSRNLTAPVVHDPPALASAETDQERRRILLARSACQSAFNIDPRSACKLDPSRRLGGGCPGSRQGGPARLRVALRYAERSRAGGAC